jgi:hypothetical protein
MFVIFGFIGLPFCPELRRRGYYKPYGFNGLHWAGNSYAVVSALEGLLGNYKFDKNLSSSSKSILKWRSSCLLMYFDIFTSLEIKGIRFFVDQTI